MSATYNVPQYQILLNSLNQLFTPDYNLKLTMFSENCLQDQIKQYALNKEHVSTSES